VLGYPEFNTTTNVKASGSITIPLVGEVKAVGLSKDSLQNEIVLKLSEYVKSKVFVTLNLLSTTVQNIIVLGAVGSQNSYPNTAPISIFQLLANAGGPSADADLRHIKLYRNGDLNKEREIDLSGIVNAGNKGEMSIPMINPGDMVYVPKSENFLRAFSPFVSDTLILLTLFSLIK
jgi:polysaccharide export outer membrane protein